MLLSGLPSGQAPAKRAAASNASKTEEPKTETPDGKASPAADNPKEVVAVYHFTSAREFSSDYAASTGNAVEAGFVRSGRFTVVERNRFAAMKEEDKFKEANTSDLVAKAAHLGAKLIVGGHIVGVSRGSLVNASGLSTGSKYAGISLSFKTMKWKAGRSS